MLPKYIEETCTEKENNTSIIMNRQQSRQETAKTGQQNRRHDNEREKQYRSLHTLQSQVTGLPG